jgi:hypothetical protein
MDGVSGWEMGEGEGVIDARLRGRVLAFEQLQQFGRQLQELVPGPVRGVGEGNAGVL